MYPHQFVIMAIRLYRSRSEYNMSISAILNILKIARSTLYEWIKTYPYKNENEYNISKQQKREIIKQKYDRKISDRIVTYIVNYVKNNPICNIKKLKLQILKQYRENINKNYIYKILKNNNITHKKLNKNKYPYDDNKINDAKKNLKNEIKYVKNKVISLDEVSFELGSKCDYGWSEKGKRCTIKVTNKRKRYSIIMAISRRKVVNYEIVAGTVNGEKFKKFICDKIIPTIRNNAILMDNARIHHYKELKKYMKEKEIKNKIIYNIPYMPKYNPIEYVFNTIKIEYKRMIIETQEELVKFLDKKIAELNKKGFGNYFDKSFNELE